MNLPLMAQSAPDSAFRSISKQNVCKSCVCGHLFFCAKNHLTRLRQYIKHGTNATLAGRVCPHPANCAQWSLMRTLRHSKSAYATHQKHQPWHAPRQKIPVMKQKVRQMQATRESGQTGDWRKRFLCYLQFQIRSAEASRYRRRQLQRLMWQRD